MLGYQDRSAALDPKDAQKIVPGGNGMFLPTIVSKGRVVGTWKRIIKKKIISVVPSPFTALTKTKSALSPLPPSDIETSWHKSARNNAGSYPVKPKK